MSLGKQILEVIDKNGIEVTMDLDYPSLPDAIQDKCVELLIREDGIYADECIPINSSALEASPANVFYDNPGIYIAACFECVDQISLECMNTESVLKTGMNERELYILLSADPCAFLSRVKSSARTYLLDKINELILEAIPEFIKGEGKWH